MGKFLLEIRANTHLAVEFTINTPLPESSASSTESLFSILAIFYQKSSDILGHRS